MVDGKLKIKNAKSLLLLAQVAPLQSLDKSPRENFGAHIDGLTANYDFKQIGRTGTLDLYSPLERDHCNDSDMISCRMLTAVSTSGTSFTTMLRLPFCSRRLQLCGC